jgi:hypothetical protein
MIRLAIAPIVLGLVLGIASFSHATAQSYLTAPADPKVRVRDPGYVDVTAGVKTFEVTGPKDWIEQNRQVAPQSGASDTGQDSTSRARRAR